MASMQQIDEAVYLDAATVLACQKSLMVFVDEFWNVIESQPFVRNWHHDLIAEHVEAVSAGQIENLLINIPPGCTKSLMVCVMWPCWEWVRDPSLRWFFASYHQHLATRDSTKCRKLLESPKFQRWWGKRILFASDQNQKTYYETTVGGYRLATSIGGHATGEHMDRIVVDDPHDVEQSLSDTQRKQATDWWDLTMSTRGVSRRVRRVIVMQRLHTDDLTGHILETESDQWEHICLPMRAEAKRMKTTVLGGFDPRKKEGELLFPKLFSEGDVKKLEASWGCMVWPDSCNSDLRLWVVACSSVTISRWCRHLRRTRCDCVIGTRQRRLMEVPTLVAAKWLCTVASSTSRI